MTLGENIADNGGTKLSYFVSALTVVLKRAIVALRSQLYYLIAQWKKLMNTSLSKWFNCEALKTWKLKRLMEYDGI